MGVVQEAKRLARKLHEEGLVDEKLPTPEGELEAWASTGVWVESMFSLGGDKLIISIDLDASRVMAFLERCRPSPRLLKWILAAANAFVEEYGRIAGGRSGMPRIAVMKGSRIPSVNVDETCTYPVIIYKGYMYNEYSNAAIELDKADPIYSDATVVTAARLPEGCIRIARFHDGMARDAYACTVGGEPVVYVSTDRGLYRVLSGNPDVHWPYPLKDLGLLETVAEKLARDLYKTAKIVAEIIS